MSIYRTLLAWLALALLGALLWDWLASDPGTLVISLRGQTISTSVAFALALWGVAWFALWAIVWLLRLPLRLWRRHTRNRARSRLAAGLDALHQGQWQRAGNLLELAASEASLRSAALLAARRAADARADHEASARLLTELATHHPVAAALDQAKRLLAQNRAEEALAALKAAGDSPLPPRGLQLQIEAQLRTGYAHESGPLLTRLRQDKALPPAELANLDVRISAAILQDAGAADSLLQRWRALPARLQDLPVIAGAFAQRAAVLGLEAEGGAALAQALGRHWDEHWVDRFSHLPSASGQSWLSSCEHWLPSHSDSPALLVALGRLCRKQQLWGKAEDYLHRALAHGAGGDAWEELGHVFSAQNDVARAQVAFANALRAARQEAPLTVTGRSLRDQIADQAVAEQRNAHGLPLLPR